jgi:hypothetical protein
MGDHGTENTTKASEGMKRGAGVRMGPESNCRESKPNKVLQQTGHAIQVFKG